MEDVQALLSEGVRKALQKLAAERGVAEEALPQVELERPKREGQGDWATNAAMKSSKAFGARPRDLAEELAARIPVGDEGYVEKVEVAGPGFINFFLNRRWMGSVLDRVLREGDSYGKSDIGRGRKVQVEFVSANPTGPLHIGHGRGAAVGDVTAAILEHTGWQVEREYLINDAGLQMDILGRSTQARYFELLGKPEQAPFPEDGYKGDYIYDIAREIIDAEGERFLAEPLEESMPWFRQYAEDVILAGIRDDLRAFGVTFDVWFSEKSLYRNGRDAARETVDLLKEKDYAYAADGAEWFGATRFGDEKDRVLIRSNGAPTYFVSDMAYHKDKYDRGFDMVINVWGADHHGYVPRMKAGVEALGRSPEDLQILLIQFVSLLRGGEQVPMSTRAGQFVTLRDVVEEVGRDATRYFFLMRRSNSHLDFDLDLAKSTSSDNPVYYVQYAHARIQSVFAAAEAAGREIPEAGRLDVAVLDSREEQNLVRRLDVFGEELEKAARDLEPHRLVYYLHQLACDFHAFYNAHRVLGEERSVEASRLLLLQAVRVVLRNALNLLGVTAPDSM
ncbi:MAG: arginine--tRNA ligase [Synergistales bacterium]|nr:arginine--tRNA ligase [Synergistales bacterium]